MGNKVFKTYWGKNLDYILKQYLKLFQYEIPGVIFTTSSEFTLNPELEEENIYGADIFMVPTTKLKLVTNLVREIRKKLLKKYGIVLSIVLHTKEDTERYYSGILEKIQLQREITYKIPLYKPWLKGQLNCHLEYRKEFPFSSSTQPFGEYGKKLVKCEVRI